MDAASGEFRGARLAVGGGRDTIVLTIERDRGHDDRRQRGKPPLDVGIARIAFDEAIAVAVAVDDDVDIIRIVVRDRRALQASLVELSSSATIAATACA